MGRIGVASYWVSDDSWSWFKARSKAEGSTIRAFIEKHYHEWTTAEMGLVIRDDALRPLYEERKDLLPRDGVLYRAMYVEWGGRHMRSLDLEAACVTELALAAIRWQLPYKMSVPTPVGLAALALEMIGREWIEVSNP